MTRKYYRKKKVKYGSGPTLTECFDEHVGKLVKNAFGYLQGVADEGAKTTQDSINKIRNSVKESSQDVGNQLKSEVETHLNTIQNATQNTQNGIQNFQDKIDSLTNDLNREKDDELKKQEKYLSDSEVGGSRRKRKTKRNRKSKKKRKTYRKKK